MSNGSLAVCELPDTAWSEWDRFVVASPQGTLFSETLWLRLTGVPFRIFGCYKGEELVGGTAVLEGDGGKQALGVFPLTPYQGILFRPYPGAKLGTQHSLEMRITGALLDTLEQRYRDVMVVNHYTFHDVRPFYFRTYGTASEYRATVRYTHVVDLTDLGTTWNAIDDNTHWEIRKAEKGGIMVFPSADFDRFDQIHQHTFDRQGVDRDLSSDWLHKIYEVLNREKRCELFLAFNSQSTATAGVLTVWDSKRAYFLLGGAEPQHRNNGSSSLALWTAFQSLATRLPEIDLEGCNSPRRGSFKAGFGGQLRHYFWLSLYRPQSGERR